MKEINLKPDAMPHVKPRMDGVLQWLREDGCMTQRPVLKGSDTVIPLFYGTPNMLASMKKFKANILFKKPCLDGPRGKVFAVARFIPNKK